MSIPEWDCTKTYAYEGDIVTFKGNFYKSVEALDFYLRPRINVNECPVDPRKYYSGVFSPFTYGQDISDLWQRVQIKYVDGDVVLHIGDGDFRGCNDVEVMEHRRKQDQKSFKAVQRLSNSLWGC